MSRRFGFSLGLGERFALTIFFLSTCLVGGSVLIQTRLAKRALVERSHESNQVIFDSLASLCRARLAAENFQELKHGLTALVELNRLAYIDLFSPTGTPLLQLTNPLHGRASVRETEPLRARERIVWLTAPLATPEKTLGRLEVGFWVGGITEEAQRLEQEGLYLGLALCLCLAFVSYFLGFWLARRLKTFTQLVERLPETGHPFPVTGSDEVTALARAFNERHRRLQQALVDRARAEQNREEVTHMIVHDLKGPLSGFHEGIGLLEESLEGNPDASVSELLGVMKKGTARLLKMIDGILQVARLEDPDLKLKRTPFDVIDLANRRISETALAAKRRGIDLQLKSASRQPIYVSADPEMIGRVVDNLLFNALEHTPPGQRVAVTMTEQSGTIRLDVFNPGPSIPPDQLEQIFEKFHKAGITSGVGLGLAFCKLAIQRHGGRIGLDNLPDGVRFYFELPVIPSPILSLTHSTPLYHG